MPDQVPEEVKRERIERLIERRPADRGASGTPSASAAWSRCSSRGRAAPIPPLLRGRTRRNTTVNFAGAAQPGDLVDVAIEGATSTTLRGTQAALVAA